MPCVSLTTTSFSASTAAATSPAAVSALQLSLPPVLSRRSGRSRESCRRPQSMSSSLALTLGDLAHEAQVDLAAVLARQEQLLAEQHATAERVQAHGLAAQLLEDAADRPLICCTARARRWSASAGRCSGGPGRTGSRPASLMALLMALPPPWTMIGRMPTVFMKTTSVSRFRWAASSSSTLPPSLMTTILSRNARMYPIASIKASAFAIASCTK